MKLLNPILGFFKKKKIKELITAQDWDLLILVYSFKEICFSLNFSEAMHVVDRLFFEDFCNDDRQQYALKLAFKMKEHFKNEWESDWKNEVYLGNLCNVLWCYEEEYHCYKRAYERLEDPPIELLLCLAHCNNGPPPVPITAEETEFYLKKALEKELTYRVASTLRYFYERKKDKSQERYWNRMCKKLKNNDEVLVLPPPDALKK